MVIETESGFNIEVMQGDCYGIIVEVYSTKIDDGVTSAKITTEQALMLALL